MDVIKKRVKRMWCAYCKAVTMHWKNQDNRWFCEDCGAGR